MVDLVSEIVIVRNITYLVYLWSGSCLVLFLFILWRMGLFKRALAVVGVSFIINIGWEISLWLTNSRAYDSGLPVWFEFTYHGFTELAPFLLFWMICLKLFGFIGKDKKKKSASSEEIGGEEDERAGDIDDSSGVESDEFPDSTKTDPDEFPDSTNADPDGITQESKKENVRTRNSGGDDQ